MHKTISFLYHKFYIFFRNCVTRVFHFPCRSSLFNPYTRPLQEISPTQTSNFVAFRRKEFFFKKFHKIDFDYNNITFNFLSKFEIKSRIEKYYCICAIQIKLIFQIFLLLLASLRYFLNLCKLLYKIKQISQLKI